MKAQLGEESIIKANAQFWEQMLSMKLEPLPARQEIHMAAGHVLGRVGVSGVWTGHIEVRLSGRLASEATAAMMMVPVETVGEADALDATKEIANIIGGVIKSSLPRPCNMTVPESGMESEGYTDRSNPADSIVVAFEHPSGGLLVSVWEQECLP